MAGGWAKDGAVQDQIDASVDEAVARAKSQMLKGKSAEFCEECDEPIPEPRRIALPGVQLCINCQTDKAFTTQAWHEDEVEPVTETL